MRLREDWRGESLEIMQVGGEESWIKEVLIKLEKK